MVEELAGRVKSTRLSLDRYNAFTSPTVPKITDKNNITEKMIDTKIKQQKTQDGNHGKFDREINRLEKRFPEISEIGKIEFFFELHPHERH